MHPDCAFLPLFSPFPGCFPSFISRGTGSLGARRHKSITAALARRPSSVNHAGALVTSSSDAPAADSVSVHGGDGAFSVVSAERATFNMVAPVLSVEQVRAQRDRARAAAEQRARDEAEVCVMGNGISQFQKFHSPNNMYFFLLTMFALCLH